MAARGAKNEERADDLAQLAKAANDRAGETERLAEVAIRHRPVILQALQSLIIVDPRRRVAVQELLEQIDRTVAARKAVDNLTARILNHNQPELIEGS